MGSLDGLTVVTLRGDRLIVRMVPSAFAGRAAVVTLSISFLCSSKYELAFFGGLTDGGFF